MASSGDSSKDDGCRSSSTNMTISKKQKMTVTEVEEALDDHISELPDSLLVQILSLLSTKDALATCVLSKRWRYLWTFVFNFSFDSTDFHRFESFVDYVFAHSASSKIKRLLLDCCRPYEIDLQTRRWLSFAVEKRVENVVFWSGDHSNYTLPESFTCSSLKTLVFFDCYFDNDAVIAWKSLKSINLFLSVISDEDVANILSGCPALESMELSLCQGFHRLEINSLKFKTLKLNGYDRATSNHSLKIFAPYLQHLEISGVLYYLKCRLVDVSSVVNVKLTFYNKCIKAIWGEESDEEEEDSCHHYHQLLSTLVLDYFQKLSRATDLTIGTWITMVLCLLQFEGVQIPKLKCKYLTLKLHMKKFNLYE